MKKSKLIATLCTLVLTLACLTFGVYSAVKTSFTASGTITFNAYGINLDIDMSFAGTETAIENKYVSTHKDRSEHLTSGQTYTDISAGVTGLDLAFDEFTIPEGKTEPELKITMTLNVKNYSGFAIMATPTLKFGASGAEAAATFDSTFTSTLTNGVVNLADKATAAITIEISPKGTTAITSNNNFKFEFEFAPYDYTSYYTAQGYTMLENGVNCTINNDELSNYRQLTGVTKIMIPEGVKTIKESSIDCSRITSVAIPSSVTSIEYQAFYGLGNMVSINVDNGNKIYDSRDNCNAIIETATDKLIFGCGKTIIPTSVKTIGEVAFGSCNFTSITIPNGVTSIGISAFAYCSNLTSITIPSSVTNIGQLAFTECTFLTSINFLGTKAQWNAITLGDDWDMYIGTYTIHCTDGDIAKS